MTPTASQTPAVRLASENPADNTTYTIASNLRHSLPALGIEIPRIFVEDQKGTEVAENAVLALDKGAASTPAKWMLQLPSGQIRNAADAARRVNAVQRVEDSNQAFSAWMNLCGELGGLNPAQAEDALLQSGIVRQAVVNHLRSINLQGVVGSI